MGAMTAQDQLDLFAGCVYVLSANRVRMPDGKLLDQKRFNVEFPGLYATDNYGGRTTRSAWMAFTQNQAYRPPIDKGYWVPGGAKS